MQDVGFWHSGIEGIGCRREDTMLKGEIWRTKIYIELGKYLCSYNTQEIIKVLLGKYLCSYNTQEITIIKVLF